MIIDITNRYNSSTFVYGSGTSMTYSTIKSYYPSELEVNIICPQVTEIYIVAKFVRRWLA